MVENKFRILDNETTIEKISKYWKIPQDGCWKIPRDDLKKSVRVERALQSIAIGITTSTTNG